jgi:hypothetical protein
MPCYDPLAAKADRDAHIENRNLRRELNQRTKYLCAVLGGLTPEQLVAQPEEVQRWWREHQRFDADRRKTKK